MGRTISTNATFISATASPNGQAGFIIPEDVFNEINSVAQFITQYMPVPTIDFTLLMINAQPDLSNVPEDVLSTYQDVITITTTAPDGYYIFVKDCTIAFPQLTNQQQYAITLELNYDIAAPVNAWGAYSQALKCVLASITSL